MIHPRNYKYLKKKIEELKTIIKFTEIELKEYEDMMDEILRCGR